MHKIIDEAKLSFDDVLMVPQRSTLTSRSEIKLERTFSFYHSPRKWKGIPIVCANMGFCSFELAKALASHKMIACLHKYHTVESLVKYFKENPENIDYTFISIGYKKSDLNHLLEFKERFGEQPNICVDVPNGHMDVFVKYCKKVREHFPESIILAGNVTNTSSTQELIIYGGVDIVKVGIGGGCGHSGVKVITKDRIKLLKDVIVGDEVLTHKNRFKKVINTSNQKSDNTFVEVNGNKFTADHKFYVLHKSYKEKIITDKDIETYGEWISCADLSSDYFLIKNKHES
jgi:hypothetical protein